MSNVDTTMSEDTTLAVRTRAEIMAENPQLAAQTLAMEVLQQRAKILIQSELLPDTVNTWQKAAAIIMRAETLEVDYWTGLMHLNAIKGAPQPDGQLCMAMIERSELMEDYAIIETTDQTCSLRMKRVGRPAFVVTCTMDEYRPLAGPDAKRQPKTHLFWYTYKQGARRLFSDVLNNMQPKNAAKFSRIIVDDDLRTDLAADMVYVIEEGEDKPATATVPLSAATNGSGSPSATAENVASAETIPELGSLDMYSLQQRALNTHLVENEFHFANLLKQFLNDGTIREGTTADKVLDAMRKHKAEKDFDAFGGGG